MSVTELIESAQFVVDAEGNKKAVLLDFLTWQEVLPWLERLESLEAQLEAEEIEDSEIVRQIEARLERDEESVRDWAEFEAELEGVSA